MVDLPPEGADVVEWLCWWDKKKIKKFKKNVRFSTWHSRFSWLDKEYYHTKEYLDLVKEFVYCYSYLCSNKAIKLKDKKWWSSIETKYDMDAVTLIYLLKQMHLLCWKNIWYNKWILVRWFAFDKDFLKHWTNKLWDKKLWKNIDSQRLPNDYVKFFETWDLKYLEKNSFLKYKNYISIGKLFKFLGYLLNDVDTYYWHDISFKKFKADEVREDVIYLFYHWFKNLVEILDIDEKEKEYLIKWRIVNKSKFDAISEKVDKTNADRYAKTLLYLIDKYPKQLIKELF